MSSTRAQAITQALYNLGIIAEGQAVTDDIVNKMDLVVDPCVAEMAAMEIYYVQDAGTANPPSGGDFDDAAFLSICDYLANRAAPAFNRAGDASLQALAMIAEEKLKKISAPTRTKRVLEVDAGARSRRIVNYRGGF
jgi:hypothetical protein